MFQPGAATVADHGLGTSFGVSRVLHARGEFVTGDVPIRYPRGAPLVPTPAVYSVIDDSVSCLGIREDRVGIVPANGGLNDLRGLVNS